MSSPQRVLIIDDEIQVARALRRLLSRSGYQVEVAHGADEGLARFEETAPAVVISDFYMPDKNGYELVREVLRRAPRTVALLLSGSLEISSDASRLCDVLWKPWNEEVVLSLIARRLAERKAA
jgi:two-component system, OmpR family, response regulator VicR